MDYERRMYLRSNAFSHDHCEKVNEEKHRAHPRAPPPHCAQNRAHWGPRRLRSMIVCSWLRLAALCHTCVLPNKLTLLSYRTVTIRESVHEPPGRGSLLIYKP